MLRLVVIAAITTLAAAKDQCGCANAVPNSKSVDLLEDALGVAGKAQDEARRSWRRSASRPRQLHPARAAWMETTLHGAERRRQEPILAQFRL